MEHTPETVGQEVVEQAQTVLVMPVVEEKPKFEYSLTNVDCTVAKVKNLINAIIKTLEADESTLVSFDFEVIGNINLSKKDTTIADMKSIVKMMLNMIEKDIADVPVAFTFIVTGK